MADEVVEEVETETTENTDEATKDESKEAPKDEKIDYEAELAREKEAREKAEKALATKAFKERQAKKEDVDEDDFSDEEKPLTARELEAILTRERQNTQKELQGVTIASLAKSLSGSDSEARLIVEVHKNRTFPPHYTLEEQLEESALIANKKRILGEHKEALRALRGKSGVNSNPAGTHIDPPKSSEPSLSPQDAQAIKASGFVWNGTSRQYEKKLTNGGLLIRDSKTGQVRMMRAK